MKITAMALTVLTMAWPTLAQTSQPSKDQEFDLLRAEVKMLRSQVKSQAAEIERLKAQLTQGGELKTTTQAAASTSAPSYTYMGRPISQAQFTQFYREFGKRMIVVDGKVLDAGEANAWELYHKTSYEEHRSSDSPREYVSMPGYVPDNPPPVGTVCRGTGDVSSVTRSGIIVDLEKRRGIVGMKVDPANITAQPTEGYAISYRIQLADTSKYSEGSNVNIPKVIYVGTISVTGRTLQNYVLSAPVPTEAQFADALAKGLQLNRWAIQRKPKEAAQAVPSPVK